MSARILFFAFVALSIAFAGYIAPLQRFSDHLGGHRQPYLAITIGMAAIGFVLFVAIGIVSAYRNGRRMTDAEAQTYASASLRVPGYAFYRGCFRGKATGQQFERSNSFRDIKTAFRSGAWWRDPEWWRFLSMLAGALLWLYGAFAIAFVLGAPAVKLIAAVSLIY